MNAFRKRLEWVISSSLVLFAYVYIRFLRGRWDAAVGKAILRGIDNAGIDVRLHGGGVIVGADRLVIGDYVRVGKGFYFNCLGGIDIGANCQISRNVTIYSSNHNYDSEVAVPYDDTYSLKSVVIGHSVWIGMGASILPGVVIGDGAIIGMGAVVAKNVPAGAIVVGSAQRIAKTRNMAKFRELNEISAWFGKEFKDL